MRESMFLSIYRVYNKRVNKEKVRKVRERVSAGKGVLIFVYRYNSIIEIRKRKRRGKGMFIIYRYIERYFL